MNGFGVGIVTTVVGAASLALVVPARASATGFIENQGQVDEAVRYYMSGSSASVYFTKDAIVFDLHEVVEPSEEEVDGDRPPDPALVEEPPVSRRGCAVWVRPVDPDLSMRIEARDERIARFNYFLGNDPAKWRTEVPAYGEIVYRNVRPGVDLVFRDQEGRLMFEVISKEGGQRSSPGFRYEGAASVTPDGDGGVVAETSVGSLREVRETGGMAGQFLRPVGSDALDGDRSARGDNPPVLLLSLLWSTFLGGIATDEGLALALDASGNPVVAGGTGSSNFPTTPGAYDGSLNGIEDVYVAKLSSSGATLLWGTFLGGSAAEKAFALAIDPSGNPVVTGRTVSSNFPTSLGAYDVSYNGGSGDTFVSKLSSSGSSLLWSTFLGGSTVEDAHSLALDVSGNPVVAGGTWSSNFPTTLGAYDVSYNGGPQDVFVAKLSSSGSTLLWSTFLGGSGWDEGWGLALDASGNPVVTGQTGSSNFPTTLGTYDGSYNGGGYDGFVATLSSSGSSLLGSTFLGGSASDLVFGVALDASGNPVVAGRTASSNFPMTSGAYDGSYNGGSDDAVVAKLSSSGSTLVWSTFLGGSSYEEARALALDASGNPVVAGATASSNFPTPPGAYDGSLNGGPEDAFVTKLSSSGSSLLCSTFLGGNNKDGGNALALDASGNPLVTGTAASPTFPTSPGAYDVSYNGGDWDVFVTKLTCADPLGACCLPAGICIQTTQPECDSLGGIFYASTPCTPGICDSCIVSLRSCARPPQKMKGWWPLDETSGPTASDIAWLNNCTYVGTPTLNTGTYVTNSLHFQTAADYLENTASGTVLDIGTSDFSIDAWMRTMGPRPTIVSKMQQAPDYGYQLFVLPTGRLALRMADGSVADFNSGNPNLKDGLWHHVAATVDRNSAAGGRLYVDGAVVLNFDPTARQGSLSNSAPFRIGQIAPPFFQYPFTGDIDEVEIFSRVIDSTEVVAIRDARRCGKCKKACYLNWDVSVWNGQTTLNTNLVICNYSVGTDSCRWSIAGVPGCDVSGVPLTFSPSSGAVSAAPGNPCAVIPITITIPPNFLTSNQVACYQASTINPTTGQTVYCTGSIQNNPSVICWRPVIGFAQAEFPESLRVSFVGTNTGPSDAMVDYTIEAIPGDMSAETALRLNGNPPGTPVEGSVMIEAGDSVVVWADAAFEDHDPFDIHNVILRSDVDGDLIQEALEATLVQSVLTTTVDVDGPGSPTPPPIGLGLRAFPSPFISGTMVRFSLTEGERAVVSVIDVSGRLVRRLHAGALEAGPHAFGWDGRARDGRLAGSGVYFVRVETARTAETARIIRLR